MKKAVSYFFVALLLSSLLGCGGKAEKKEQVNYVVVKIPAGTDVKDLFEFESISRLAIDDITAPKAGTLDGVFCSGVLPGGKSVVWQSDDAGANDDYLFVYVESRLSDVQIATYASKLDETPISYESFKEKYE